MPTEAPSPRQRRARRKQTYRRRAIILAMLRGGKWVHGAKLREAARIGHKSALDLVMHGLREDGYVIEGKGGGHRALGFRLISEPYPDEIAA